MEKPLETQIVDYFNRSSNYAALILFGSHATSRAVEGSDVDVAILFEPGKYLSSLELLELRTGLEEELGRDVDLVDLRTANPILGIQIYKYGKELAVKDRHEFNLYQSRLLLDYAEVKEMRKPMEDQILERRYHDR